jgi:hypothetical protein
MKFSIIQTAMSVTGAAGFPPRPNPHESWNITFPQMWIHEGRPQRFVSGFNFLKQSGIAMSATMQNLHRLERLEHGVAYLARTIPDVARLLAKRGNLGELFSPEVLPTIQEIINYSTVGSLR